MICKSLQKQNSSLCIIISRKPLFFEKRLSADDDVVASTIFHLKNSTLKYHSQTQYSKDSTMKSIHVLNVKHFHAIA
jgi:hypothetical protein